MVGGGPESFIGPVHRMAARISDCYELCATVLSSSEDKSKEMGIAMGIGQDRAYANWKEMVAKEGKRDDKVDVVTIVTPNDSHYGLSVALLSQGIHVICDKPLCNETADALDLVKKVRESDSIFCVTYNYSAYPMVRQAREMIRSGQLGEVRQIHFEYVQSGMAELVEAGQPGKWRFEKDKVGHSLILGDLGTHVFHLSEFVTSLQASKLMADVGATLHGRTGDDHVNCLLEYSNGAKGSFWVTNSAAGAEHGLSFRIFGEKGGLEWHQEYPNELKHRRLNNFMQLMTRRSDGLLQPAAERSSYVQYGHPEGYQEAFGNLYKEVAEAIYSKEQGIEAKASYPGVIDGARGVAFIDCALKSNSSKGWVDYKLDL